MSTSLIFYLDAALTTPASPAELVQQLGAGPTDLQMWLGSVAASTRFRAVSDPGVDPITIEIADTAPAGGEPVTAIKLALTQAGLAGATAGVALEVGQEILSGVANAIPFWVRWSASSTEVGVYMDLSLQTVDVAETPA